MATYILVPILQALVVGIHYVVRRQKSEYLLQYLFFVRFPILMGTALVLLPVVFLALPSLLRNLLELTPPGVFIVMVYAAICAWSVAYTYRLTWKSTPFRVGLLLNKDENSLWHKHELTYSLGDCEVLSDRAALWSLLLTAPLAVVLVILSSQPGWAIVAALGGIGAATLVRAFSGRLARWHAFEAWVMAKHQQGPDGKDRLARGLLAAYELCPRELCNRDDLRPLYRRMHVRAAIFALVAFVTYVIAGVLPGVYAPALESIPPLLFVLAGFTVVTWLLGFLAFQVDDRRLPLTAVVVAVVVAASLLPSGHIYRTTAWEGGQPEFVASMNARLGRAGDKPVLVAISGGGIAASLWSARVLAELEAELDAERFHDKVALVSAVSGGAVTAMHYANGFTGSGPPSAERLQAIVDAVGQPSLSAAVWGAMYSDAVRPFFWWLFGSRDRGAAMEHMWGTRLNVDAASLESLSEGVASGWRPIPVFNATAVETGERLLISPVAIRSDGNSARRTWAAYAPNRNLALTTAARLSATFPFVSPHARPDNGARIHAADGGYFDNSGIVTALDLWREYLSAISFDKRSKVRVALIEIRAGGSVDSTGEQDREPSLMDDLQWLLGPLQTLYNVRGASQLARADADIARTLDRFPEVELKRFTFRLSDAPPLSWQLTQDEAKRILAHWPTDSTPQCSGAICEAAEQNRATLAELRTFLAREPAGASRTVGRDPAIQSRQPAPGN